MKHLDSPTLQRLAKLCGMLGSSHDGERASAAALADRLIREHGLTWPDVIAAKPAQSVGADAHAAIALVLANLDLLNDWERGFIRDIAARTSFTEKQLAKLEVVAAKVRAHRGGGQ